MTVYVDNAAAEGLAGTSCLWADTPDEMADFVARLAAGGLPLTSHTGRVAWVGERHRTRAILMDAIPVRACDTVRLMRAARHRAEVG